MSRLEKISREESKPRKVNFSSYAKVIIMSILTFLFRSFSLFEILFSLFATTASLALLILAGAGQSSAQEVNVRDPL
ncbi:MAG: hypothetical protein LBE01_05950, partial [Deltaproteobacteria bacterium]|nr:hypothetical protein [Deltaproteobacteria bacterium]